MSIQDHYRESDRQKRVAEIFDEFCALDLATYGISWPHFRDARLEGSWKQTCRDKGWEEWILDTDEGVKE